MIARLRPALWLLMTAQLVPATSAATEPNREAVASAWFEKGNTLYDAGKNAEAEAAFEEAWKLRKSYDLAGNMGQAELRQGKMLEALEHLRYALDNAPVGFSKKKRGAIEAEYLRALAGVGVLKITVEPAGAKVEVDGAGTVAIPEGLAVEPGDRQVRASELGFVSEESRVTVRAGETREVRLTLAKEPPSTAAGPNGSTASRQLPPVDAKGSAWPDKTTVAWAGGGATAALGITGVVLVILANGKASDAEEQRAALSTEPGTPRCGEGGDESAGCAGLRDTLDGQKNLANGAFWTLVGAGVVGAATAGYWLWAPEGGAGTGVVATPVVGDRQAGILLEGSF